MHRDVHIESIDRPGYGSSDPWPEGAWPTVSGAADDIGAYLEASLNTVHELGITQMDHVGVVGWSAGGRVALALAAKYPHLVDRVAIVGTPAPNEQVQWMSPDLTSATARLTTLGAQEAIGTLSAMLQENMAAELPGSDPEAHAPLGLLGVSDADRIALVFPGARLRLDRMLRNAFRQGWTGLASDILSYTARDWGFDLKKVRADTLLLYGDEDPVAGIAHARWYQKHLPDAEIEMVPDAGHLLVIPAWDRVLSHVAPGTLTT